MNEMPPPDDGAEDLDAQYRSSSTRDASRPSATVRRAILEHASQVAASRVEASQIVTRIHRMPTAPAPASKFTGSPGARWRRSLLAGSLAAAALAMLLIGPQYLHFPAAPVTPVTAPAATPPQLSRAVPPAPQPAPPEQTEAVPPAANQPAPTATPPVEPSVARAVPRAVLSESASSDRESSAARDSRLIDEALSARNSASAAVSAEAIRAQRLPAPAAQTNSAAAVARSNATEASVKGPSPVDVRDSDGRTELMLAVLQGRADSVADLLRRGADPNAKDNAGVTPLQAARARDESAIVDALMSAGAH